MDKKKLKYISILGIIISFIAVGTSIEVQITTKILFPQSNQLQTASLQKNLSLGDINTSFTGENLGDQFGYSISSVGDVNGDGLDDFLIGALYYNEDQGKAYLFFGNTTDIWGNEMSSSQANASFVGEASYDLFGSSVAGVGDVNKDGYDDFLIGAYNATTGNNGKAYLFYGNATNIWGHNFNCSQANATFIGEVASDLFGHSVAGAGDVNGDNYDDFLIGTTSNDEGGNNAGKTYLFYGNATNIWGHNFNCSYANASFIGENDNDRSSNSIAGAGDVNGDGYDDFLIGAYQNGDAGSGAGKSYLFCGTDEDVWLTGMSCSEANASFTGENAQNRFGFSVAGAGDVNNDGFNDFIIGASYYDLDIGKEGKSYLFFGSNEYLWASGLNSSKANASFIGESKDSYSGSSVAGVGDVNGDGFDDFIIGAYRFNISFNDDRGKSYVIFGKRSGWEQSTNLSRADASYIGESPYDYSGQRLASAGDVNGDGYDDILIDSFRSDAAAVDAGKVYLIFGASTSSPPSLLPILVLLSRLSSENNEIPTYPPFLLLPIAASTILATLYLNYRKKTSYI